MFNMSKFILIIIIFIIAFANCKPNPGLFSDSLDIAGSVIGKSIKGAGSALGEFGDTLGKSLQNTSHKFGNALEGLFRNGQERSKHGIGVFDIISGAIGSAGKLAGGTAKAAGTVVGAGVVGVGNMAKVAGHLVGTGVKLAIHVVGEVVEDLAKPVLDITIGNAARAAGGVLNVAGTIVGTGVATAGQVLNAAGTMLDQGVKVASNIIQNTVEHVAGLHGRIVTNGTTSIQENSVNVSEEFVPGTQATLMVKPVVY